MVGAGISHHHALRARSVQKTRSGCDHCCVARGSGRLARFDMSVKGMSKNSNLVEAGFSSFAIKIAFSKGLSFRCCDLYR